MQLLIVLFLVVVLTVIGVGIFMGISFGIGAYLNSRTGNRADPRDPNPCAQCNADFTWYQELPEWQRSVAMAWWWINRFLANRKGC